MYRIHEAIRLSQIEQITTRKMEKNISSTGTIVYSLFMASGIKFQSKNEVVQNKEQINIKYFSALNMNEYD